MSVTPQFSAEPWLHVTSAASDHNQCTHGHQRCCRPQLGARLLVRTSSGAASARTWARALRRGDNPGRRPRRTHARGAAAAKKDFPAAAPSRAPNTTRIGTCAFWSHCLSSRRGIVAVRPRRSPSLVNVPQDKTWNGCLHTHDAREPPAPSQRWPPIPMVRCRTAQPRRRPHPRRAAGTKRRRAPARPSRRRGRRGRVLVRRTRRRALRAAVAPLLGPAELEHENLRGNQPVRK